MAYAAASTIADISMIIRLVARNTVLRDWSAVGILPESAVGSSSKTVSVYPAAFNNDIS